MSQPFRQTAGDQPHSIPQTRLASNEEPRRGSRPVNAGKTFAGAWSKGLAGCARYRRGIGPAPAAHGITSDHGGTARHPLFLTRQSGCPGRAGRPGGGEAGRARRPGAGEPGRAGRPGPGEPGRAGVGEAGRRGVSLRRSCASGPPAISSEQSACACPRTYNPLQKLAGGPLEPAGGSRIRPSQFCRF